MIAINFLIGQKKLRIEARAKGEQDNPIDTKKQVGAHRTRTRWVRTIREREPARKEQNCKTGKRYAGPSQHVRDGITAHRTAQWGGHLDSSFPERERLPPTFLFQASTTSQKRSSLTLLTRPSLL